MTILWKGSIVMDLNLIVRELKDYLYILLGFDVEEEVELERVRVYR